MSAWGKRKLSNQPKAKPKRPEVVAFHAERAFPDRCSVCCDKEMRDWLSECLKETLKLGEKRPLGSRVHRELLEAFGDKRAPWSDSSTRRHLRDHEPLWRKWDEP